MTQSILWVEVVHGMARTIDTGRVVQGHFDVVSDGISLQELCVSERVVTGSDI